MKRVLVLIILALFVLLWGGAAVVSGLQLWRGLASRTWPTVEGQMISSEAVPSTARRSRGRYELRVAYRYQVEGAWHQAQRIRATAHTYGKEEAERQVGLWSSGSTVTVYYNPQNPALSYLESGVSFMEVLFPFLATGIFILVTVAFVYEVRHRRDPDGTSESKSSRYILPSER